MLCSIPANCLDEGVRAPNRAGSHDHHVVLVNQVSDDVVLIVRHDDLEHT